MLSLGGYLYHLKGISIFFYLLASAHYLYYIVQRCQLHFLLPARAQIQSGS